MYANCGPVPAHNVEKMQHLNKAYVCDVYFKISRKERIRRRGNNEKKRKERKGKEGKKGRKGKKGIKGKKGSKGKDIKEKAEREGLKGKD